MENEKPYYHKPKYHLTEQEQMLRFYSAGKTALRNLTKFIHTMLENAEVLNTLCGRTVFYGLNVADAVKSTLHYAQEVHETIDYMVQNDEIDSSHFRYLSGLKNQVYMRRSKVRVLAETVGLPTHKMTAGELLTYSRSR
jgi:hypothetical protein